MYVWTSNRVVEDAKKHGFTKRLSSLEDDLGERGDGQRVGEDIGADYVIFETPGRTWVILARYIRIFEFSAIAFLAGLERGRAPLTSLRQNPREEGQNLFGNLLNQARKAAEAHLAGLDDNRTGLPPLPEDLHLWVRAPRLRPEDDPGALLFESGQWVEAIRSEANNDILVRFKDLLLEAVSSPSAGRPVEGHDGARILTSELGYSILVLHVDVEDRETTRRLVFAVAPFQTQPDPDTVQECLATVQPSIREFSVSGLSSGPLAMDKVAACARRCYPEIVVAEDDIWLRIEKDDESNLALSAEELSILHGIECSCEPALPLPVFLDGQAGSGKSTMLLHVFAAYVRRALTKSTGQALPLYLTLNENLLEKARDSVSDLLRSHARFVLEDGVRNQTEEVRDCFRTWRDLLDEIANKALLSGQGRDQFKFVENRRIDFPQFRSLYAGVCTTPEMKKLARPATRNPLTPELAWYVIRSIIKGVDPDRLVGPAEFDTLQRADRIVTREVFERIHHDVWERWYRPVVLGNGCWDDQDLVRAILSVERDRLPTFPAVFCDEAQDFTRLELQLVLRLSVLLRHDLSRVFPQCIPFMFAGDPLQTLNPTGFRWESLRANFHDELAKLRTRGPGGNMALSFRTLRHNYRSTRKIVGLVNHVQAWRKRLFEIPELESQAAWSPLEGVAPKLYVLGSHVSAATLTGLLDNAIVIVPDEAGGEGEYVANDEVLTDLLQADDGQYRNVFTPIGCKGLEFDRVVLWKFGAAMPQKLFEPVEPSAVLPIAEQHFLNKLYVSMSRGKIGLNVIDTEEGAETLWNRFLESKREDWPPGEDWDSWFAAIGCLERGSATTLTEVKEQDPAKVADHLERAGMAAEDPEIMRRARWFWSEAGQSGKAAKCNAWALHFSGEFEAAGDAFGHELGNSRQARQCYWRGRCWRKLHDNFKSHAPMVRNEQASVARFMSSEPRDRSALETVAEWLDDWLSNPTQRPRRTSSQWGDFVDELVLRLRVAKDDPEFVSPEAWAYVADALRDLVAQGFRGFPSTVAWVCLRAGRASDAARYWEEAGEVDHEEYLTVKAETVGLPDALSYWAAAGRHERVVDAWDRTGRPRGANWLTRVIPSLVDQKRRTEAVEAALKVKQWDVALRLRGELDREPVEVRLRLLRSLRRGLSSEGRWSDALVVLDQLEHINPPTADQELERFQQIRELVRAEQSLRTLSHPLDDRVSRLVSDAILSPESNWRSHLAVELAGAAIERFHGVAKDACVFYEGYVDASVGTLRQHARERWIVSKRRQARLAQNDRRRLDLEKSAQSYEKGWGIPGSLLDEYPKLSESQLERPGASPMPDRVGAALPDIPGYEFKHFGERRRLRIDHDACTLTLDGLAMTVHGEEVAQSLTDGVLRFSDKATGISGTMQPDGEGAKAALEVGGETVNVRV